LLPEWRDTSSSAACIFETNAEAPARRALFRVEGSSAPDTTTIRACGITTLRRRHVSSPSRCRHE
jgi:hypothetical protein